MGIVWGRKCGRGAGCFLRTVLNGDAFGTKVSGHYRQCGCPSEAVIKRGSTVSRVSVWAGPVYRKLLQETETELLATLIPRPSHSLTNITCAIYFIEEPPNKGHFGDNINSDVLSLTERLSSFWTFSESIGKVIFGIPSSVLCREV